MANRRRVGQNPVAPQIPVVQVQRRAKEPPIFEGNPQEDIVAWLEEYQDVADFNMWTPEESLHNVRWALKNFAKNWFRNLNPPPATFVEFSQAIRSAFKHPAYDSGIATQLRNRKQGLDESPVMYCYDKLNLCNKVDPVMTEAVKLDHLIRGMKPTLVEKIYPSIDFANPNTVAFVQLVQLHHQATWVANSNDWAPSDKEKTASPSFCVTPGTSNSGNAVSKNDQLVSHSQLVSHLTTFESKLKSQLESQLRGELVKHKQELRTELKDAQEKGFEELLTSIGKTIRDEIRNLQDE